MISTPDYVPDPLDQCAVCGVLVADDLAHTTFHETFNEMANHYAERLVAAEVALARAALDARAVRSLAPPVGGSAADDMVDPVHAGMEIPPGRVRIIVQGSRDVAAPAAEMLADLLGLTRWGPILRDTGTPGSEQRAYLGDLDTIRAAAGDSRPAGAELADAIRTAAGGRRSAPAGAELAPEADVEPREGSGVVRVRLEGDPDDIELAVELAEATAFPLAELSDAYLNSKGPRGRVRRYGVVNLGGRT